MVVEEYGLYGSGSMRSSSLDLKASIEGQETTARGSEFHVSMTLEKNENLLISRRTSGLTKVNGCPRVDKLRRVIKTLERRGVRLCKIRKQVQRSVIVRRYCRDLRPVEMRREV